TASQHREGPVIASHNLRLLERHARLLTLDVDERPATRYFHYSWRGPTPRSPQLLAAHSLQERRPLRGGGVQVTQVTVLGVAYRSTTFSRARLHAVATTAVAVAGLVPLSGHHQRAPCISSMRVRDSGTGRAALRSSAKVRS